MSVRSSSSPRTGKRENPVRAGGRLDLGRRHRDRQRLEPVVRQQHRAGVALLERQRADEHPLLGGVQQALAARLRHEARDLVARERARHLVAHGHPEEPQQAVRHPVQGRDRRPQDPHDEHERRPRARARPAPARRGRCSSGPSRRAPRARGPPRRARSRSRSGAGGTRGMPMAWNGVSSRCAIAGSTTASSSSEQIVMPSCAPASMSEMFSIARSAVFARREPSWARGSTVLRRAEISANSAPTKNALHTSSRTPMARARRSLIRRRPRRRARADRPPSAGGRRAGHPSRAPRRRICLRAPSSSRASNSTASPTRGTRPSRSVTRPASVS